MAKKQEDKKSLWGSKVQGLPFPSDIIQLGRVLELTTSERMFLVALRASMNDKNKSCWKSQQTLADEIGCGTRQVRRIINRLEGLEIITIEAQRKTNRRHGNNTYVYRFNYPWPGVKADICDTLKRTFATPKRTKADICDSQSGHPCPPNSTKGKKQRKENRSSSIGSDDDSRTSSQGEAETRKIGEPASLDQIRKWYGVLFKDRSSISLDDFHDMMKEKDGRVNLGRLVTPFRFWQEYKCPGPDWYDQALEDFVERFIKENWNPKAEEDRGGMFELLRRAGPAGVLGHFGFAPRSPEEKQAEAEEKARALAKAQARQAERERKAAKLADDQRRLREAYSDEQVREWLRGLDDQTAFEIEAMGRDGFQTVEDFWRYRMIEATKGPDIARRVAKIMKRKPSSEPNTGVA